LPGPVGVRREIVGPSLLPRGHESMPTSDADRNLLYGLLALQNHFVDQADLIAAFHDWTRDKGRSIGDILIGRGLLDADAQALLDALARKHMEDHGGNPRRSLASMGPAGLTEADLTGSIRPWTRRWRRSA
jgi:hypothetical protein